VCGQVGNTLCKSRSGWGYRWVGTSGFPDLLISDLQITELTLSRNVRVPLSQPGWKAMHCTTSGSGIRQGLARPVLSPFVKRLIQFPHGPPFRFSAAGTFDNVRPWTWNPLWTTSSRMIVLSYIRDVTRAGEQCWQTGIDIFYTMTSRRIGNREYLQAIRSEERRRIRSASTHGC